ncbi:MAG: helix-turn-helix transcriptional regulator [Desulfitobacterium hafniense]|nr:helix-turn-helix transcriptional regulator [Desulfitobacterium hafniense]
MPFVKVNIQDETEKFQKEDPEFAREYEIIETEYELIKMAVEMRKQLGVTQPEIAQESGLSQQAVSRLEKVGHSPTLRNFLKYLSGMGIEIELKKKAMEKDERLAV